MIVFACVDDNFGLCFNKRRQSRDKTVYERIYEIIGDKKLYITDFSKDLFNEDKVLIKKEAFVSDNEDAFFFIENEIPQNLVKAEKIILFFWNRNYPHDFKFALPDCFKEVNRYEFKGNSHDKITEITYEKII